MNKLALSCIFLVIANFAMAQRASEEKCATVDQDQINRFKYPEMGSSDDFERALQIKIIEMEEARKSGRTKAEIITIPIVVHVVHDGEEVGTGRNISQEQVNSQLEVLNEDFRKLIGTPGENNNPVGADVEIEFCLAAIDENGTNMNEPGIHRYDGNRPSWTRNEIEGILKPATSWNPNLYYNVWVLDFASEDALLAGYGQFPDQSGLQGLNEDGGPGSTDGVVVRYQSFGSSDKGNFPVLATPTDKGRVLTHETGHWLGLRHIWGDGPCGADDFVGDTPESDAPSRGCAIGAVNCGSTDMVENYMDYSDDACMNIFTVGQKARMLAVMEVSPRRASLVANSICGQLVAEVPVPNFTTDKDFVLKGGSVSFFDISSNFPATWLWTFDGGSPANSSERNPKVTYSEAGFYKVSLMSSNSIGDSELIEVDSAIEVSTEGLCNTLTNFSGTESVLTYSGDTTGFVAGHNSIGSLAYSEFYSNQLGYSNLSGTKIKFGHAVASSEDSYVTVTVWNARGVQSGPGAIVEQKQVLLRQIIEDIDADRETEVVFSRRVPLFGKGFHIGIEVDQESGNEIALVTTANGEANNSTSWVKDGTGLWNPFSIQLGLNIASKIEAIIGMNESIQLSVSSHSIFAGEEVRLDAKGASIFSWSANDGSIDGTLGPQLLVTPSSDVIYTVAGSGLELCDSVATANIYVKSPTSALVEINKDIRIYPNPASNLLTIEIDNAFIGIGSIEIVNTAGQVERKHLISKHVLNLKNDISLDGLMRGMYLIRVQFGEISNWHRIVIQ